MSANPANSAYLWHNLYVSTSDHERVAIALHNSLQEQGYISYDPFAGGMGTPPGLTETVKMFVAPSQDNWVRILGEVPASITLPFTYLRGWVGEHSAGFSAWEGNTALQITDFLRAPYTSVEWDQLINRAVDNTARMDNTSALPAELRHMAEQNKINPAQAESMFNRLTGQLFNKMDKQSGGTAKTLQTQAKQVLHNPMAVDWSRGWAARLAALASLLILPDNWRTPDFITLRDAYQVARRLKKSPKALLMNDEKVALGMVDNAIDYQPVYMGKS